MKEPYGYWWWTVRRYYPARVRWWLKETLPFKLAWLLPRKVAYFAFIRVYASMGEYGPDYDRVCHAWEGQR